MGQMSGGSGSMGGSGSGSGSGAGSSSGSGSGAGSASNTTVDGVTPIPTQTLGSADWQHMKIMAQARTAVPFVVDDGTSEKLVKPSQRTSFHLMVMLSDDRTNYPIPYASVWATVRRGSKLVFDERQWPMISEYMGPHYGNNVTLPGPRDLPAQPARQPAGVGAAHRVRAHLAQAPSGQLHVPLEPELVNRQPERPPGTALTRRRFIAGGTALVVGGGAAAALAGCGSSKSIRSRTPRSPRSRSALQPAGLPEPTVRLDRNALPGRRRQPGRRRDTTGC